MPPKDVRLETADATYFHFKTDIFKKEITYSTDKNVAANLVTIDARRVFEIIEMNRRGEKPLTLRREGEEAPAKKSEFVELVGQDNINRFDKKKKKKKKSQARSEERQAPKQRDDKNGNGDATAAVQPRPAADRQQPPREPNQPRSKGKRRQSDKQRKSRQDENPEKPARKEGDE